MEFTKEQICRHLSNFEKPKQPFFELRKLIMLEAAEPFTYNAILKMYHESRLPPCDSLIGNTCLMEILTNEDNSLLKDIFKIEDMSLFESLQSISNNDTPRLSLQRLNEISTIKFNEYCKEFTESEKKPKWDLIRVLVTDTEKNIFLRESFFEKLLNGGGLERKIKDDEVIKYDEDIYKLKKQDIKIINKNADSGYFNILRQSIGKTIAEYHNKEKNGELQELSMIILENQIDDIIKDALYRGDLPIYNGITSKICQYDTDLALYDHRNYFFYYSDLKPVLAAHGIELPEQSVFRQQGEDTQNDIKTIGNASADSPETPDRTNTDPLQPNNNDLAFSGLLNIPSNAGSWGFAIDDIARLFFKKNNRLPNQAEAWAQLCKTPPDGYGITQGKDKKLYMPSAIPLTLRAFKGRWKRYTNQT